MLLSKDLPASFLPYRSAAQFAAADALPRLAATAQSPPRATSAPRRAASISTFSALTEAQRQRVRTSHAKTSRLAKEHRSRGLDQPAVDPFASAFSQREPTRILASRREDISKALANERADAAAVASLHHSVHARRASPTRTNGPLISEHLAAFDLGRLPEPVPPLLRFAQPPAGEQLSADELRRRGVMLKLFGVHEYKMRALQNVKEPRQYVGARGLGRGLDPLQIERDNTRLMRKVVLRQRADTFE